MTLVPESQTSAIRSSSAISSSSGRRLSTTMRFGVGALWRVFADFDIRAEISHEYALAGVTFQM